MSYIVELVGFRTDEILVIDACMNLCGLSMSDAANCVDNMPAPLIRDIELDAANDIKNEFDRMGIMVEVVPSEGYDPAERKEIRRTQGRQNSMQSATPPRQSPVGSMVPPSGANVQDSRAASRQIQSQMPSMQASYNNDYSRAVPQNDYSESSQNYQNDYTLQYQQSGFEGFQTEEYKGNIPNEPFNPRSNSGSNVEYQTEPAATATQQDVEAVSSQQVPNQEDVDPTSAAAKQETIRNSVVQMSTEPENASEEPEEDKYSYTGSCPRCGSTFISVKKGGGLFGGGKIKCVCDACRYKF